MNKTESSSYLELGTSFKLHGISKKFLLHLHNREDSSLRDGLKLILFPLSETSSLHLDGEERIIEKVSFGKKVILSFEECQSYEESLSLLPFRFCILKEDLPKIKEDDGRTFYLHELLGLSVFEYGTTKRIGYLETFYDNGAQIILVIASSEKTFELPFTDEFFPSINLDEKKIEMRIPEEIEA